MKSRFSLSLVDGVPVPSSQAEMKELLDSETELLNEWLRSQGAGALTSFEDAMVRTYLVQKIRGCLDGQSSREGVNSMVTNGASVDPTTASRQ